MSRTRDAFELGTTFIEIVESLIFCAKRRLKTAQLSNRTDCQHEINRLSLALLGLRHNPDTLGHGVHLLGRIEHQISIPTAPLVDGSQRLRQAICPLASGGQGHRATNIESLSGSLRCSIVRV